MRSLILGVLVATPVTAAAVARNPPPPPTPDAEGCKDPAGVRRVQGCFIESCQTSEFDAVEMVVKVTRSGETRKRLEGNKVVTSYLCPAKQTPQKMVRSVEQSLKSAGYTMVHREEDDEDAVRLTARKRDQWVSVNAAEQDDEQNRYAITSLQVRELTQAMEKNVDGLTEELRRNGHVTLYGIQFDEDAMNPESETVLRNIAEVLKANPTWRLRVEVHTDNEGTRALNRRRSEDHGNEIVHWLIKDGGVDRTRLFSMGLGDTQPVSDNRTVEGRARNRRIELVRL